MDLIMSDVKLFKLKCNTQVTVLMHLFSYRPKGQTGVLVYMSLLVGHSYCERCYLTSVVNSFAAFSSFSPLPHTFKVVPLHTSE